MGLAHKLSIIIILVAVLCITSINCRGAMWSYTIDEEERGTYSVIPSYMYKESYITLSVFCDAPNPETKVRVNWILQEVQCMEDMYLFQTQKQTTVMSWVTQRLIAHSKEKYAALSHYKVVTDQPDLNKASSSPQTNSSGAGIEEVEFQAATIQEMKCGEKHLITLKDESESDFYSAFVSQDATPETAKVDFSKQIDVTPHHRPTQVNATDEEITNRVVKAWKDGMYHFLISISPVQMSNNTFKASVNVQLRSKSGFLPANQWPLLPYSIAMSIFYLIAGTTWVVLWARAHEHTFKIHMVIGAIAVAGAMANTLLFVNMASLNSSGQLMNGILWLVRVLSAVQDSLMHLLFMVVSTGYGITRPQMGKDLLSIIFTLASFNFASNLGLVLVLDESLEIKYNYPIETLFAMIFYGVILLCIGGYIMFMSISTLHHLFKRQHASNKVRVFTVYVISSVISFIVSVFLIGISIGIFSSCRKDWKHEWLYANFGHMVSALLLLVLMWLWVPVDTWQSYAFDPIATSEDTANMLDASDEEDELIQKKEKVEITMEPL